MHVPASRPLSRQETRGRDLPVSLAGVLAAAPLLLAVCAGIATAFYRLGVKGLWGDEVWQLAWSQQQPLTDTFLRFRAPPDLPLSFILVQLSTTFSSDPFWVRLPSAVLAAVTVVLLYVLGRRVFGRVAGVAAALLLAVAPYHVWYAQDARPYAALACYSLLTLVFFERILRRGPTPGNIIGFTLATMLNLYNHLFALFPLCVELAVAAAWAAAAWWKARRADVRAHDATREPGVHSLRALRTFVIFSGGVVVALAAAAPLFSGIAGYIANGGPSNSLDSSTRLTSGTVVDLLALFGSGSGWPLLLIAGLCVVGFGVALYRRQLFAGIALAWLALPVAILWLAHPHHMFIPRYFLFMQPVYLLMVAYGLVSIAVSIVQGVALLGAPGRMQPSHSVGTHPTSRPPLAGELPALAQSSHALVRIRPALVTLAVAALVVVTFTPSWRSYAVEKVNDWSAVCAYLHRNARLGDVITGNSYTGGLMDWCFKGTTEVTLAPPGSYALPALAASGRDVWYLMVGTDSPDLAYIRRTYTAIPRAAWAKSGLDPVTVYDNRFTYPQGEFPVTIYHHHATNLPSHLAFHETHGASINPTWPDYAQIGPGGRYTVRLSLPATRPRVLTITMLQLVGRNLDISVDHTVVARIRPRTTSLTWGPVAVALPPHAGNAILLEMSNPGTDISAVSSVALSYKSGRS